MIAVYLRVSTAKQETQSQRKAIADWCRAKTYPDDELIEYADEAISGKTTDRPAFQRMLRDIRAGKIDRVITFELSRLSRDFLGLLEVMRTLTDSGVVVEVPGEGAVQFENTIEQFMVAAKSLVAAQERERIGERTKAGIAAARARGVKWGARRGERRALGHRKDYAAENPDLVKRILALHRKGLSTYTIAEAVSTEVARISRSKVLRIIRRA